MAWFWNLVTVFCFFVFISPWKNGMVLQFNKLKTHSGYREEFLTSIMYFRCFDIISPSKGEWLCIWTNVNPFHQRMLCTKLVEIGAEFLDKNIFKMSSMYFCYFVFIYPWKRAELFMWTTFIPVTQECFLQSFFEIGYLVLKRIINDVNSLRRW